VLQDGRKIAFAILPMKKARNPKSRQHVNGITLESLRQFLQEYETPGLLAHRHKRSPGPFATHLEAKGICPLDTPKGISWIHKRRGLNFRLKQAGIEEPR